MGHSHIYIITLKKKKPIFSTDTSGESHPSLSGARPGRASLQKQKKTFWHYILHK